MPLEKMSLAQMPWKNDFQNATMKNATITNATRKISYDKCNRNNDH